VDQINISPESRFGDANIFAAKPGIYYISPNFPHGDGLFKVIDEKKVERIFKGVIEKYAVSPDGCQIAMNHDPDRENKLRQSTLKVINVCTEGN
jgi:hypothetical protein